MQLAGVIVVTLTLFAIGSTPRPPALVDAPPTVMESPYLDVLPDALPSPAPAPAPPSPTATPEPPRGRDIAGARIVISRLGIDLPLEWGDIGRDVPRSDFAGATPERLALVFPGSALPGAGGNTYIYSHARTGMFISLWNVRAGEVVELRWPDATLRYSVQRIVPRVDPSDTSWLDAGGPERLTLQTSTGPNSWDPRFVAIASPTETPR